MIIYCSSRLSKYCRYYSTFKSILLSTTSHKIQESVPINKTLLIIHGLMGSKQNWNSLSKNLKHQFKEVVLIDLRNHGESPHTDDMSLEIMAEDVRQVIVRNGYKLPILVGHSLGGKVSMNLALRMPELLSGLVVVDISPVGYQQFSQFENYIGCMMNAPIDQSQSLATNRMRIVEFMQTDITSPEIRNFLLTNLIRDSVNNEIRWRVNLESISRNLKCFFEFSSSPGALFDKPVLFIGGQKSDYIREEHWPSIMQLFPAASLTMVNDSGHWVHADKPHEFLKLLVQFGLKIDKSTNG